MAFSKKEQEEFEKLYGFSPPGSTSQQSAPVKKSSFSKKEEDEFTKLYGFSPSGSTSTIPKPSSTPAQPRGNNLKVVGDFLGNVAQSIIPGSRYTYENYIKPNLGAGITQKHEYPPLRNIPIEGTKDLFNLIKGLPHFLTTSFMKPALTAYEAIPSSLRGGSDIAGQGYDYSQAVKNPVGKWLLKDQTSIQSGQKQYEAAGATNPLVSYGLPVTEEALSILGVKGALDVPGKMTRGTQKRAAVPAAQGMLGVDQLPTERGPVVPLPKENVPAFIRKGQEGNYTPINPATGESMVPIPKLPSQEKVAMGSAMTDRPQNMPVPDEMAKAKEPLMPWEEEVAPSNQQLALETLKKNREARRTVIPEAPKVIPELPDEILRISDARKALGVPEMKNIEAPIDAPKSDIGLHDFIRDPERVLAKTGVYEQARAMHQDYLDTVSNIGKTVNETAGKLKEKSASDYKIGKFLNEHTSTQIDEMVKAGETGGLTPQEFQAANTIRTISDQLFDVSGLPKEAYIDTYITWLRDQVQAGALPGWESYIPKEISSRFTRARVLSEAPEKISAVQSFRAYVPSMIRQVVYNQYLPKMRELINELPENKRAYANMLVEDMFGQSQWHDTITENWLKSHGIDLGSNPTTRADIALSNQLYRGTIGANFTTMAKNLIQNINTAAEVGILPTIKGMARLTTKKGRELVAKSKVVDEFDQMFEKDAPIKGKIDTVLFAPMKWSEYINRGTSFLAAYHKAIKMGLGEKAAMAEGIRVSNHTQFVYGVLGKSPVFNRIPFGRTIRMFSSYPMKEIEFLNQLRKTNKGGLLRFTMLAGLGTLLIGPEDFVPQPVSAVPLLQGRNPGVELITSLLSGNPERIIKAYSNLIPANSGVVRPLTSED